MRTGRTTPFSDEELRAMKRDGDSVSRIYYRANRLDRTMTKDVIRTILFGSPR